MRLLLIAMEAWISTIRVTGHQQLSTGYEKSSTKVVGLETIEERVIVPFFFYNQLNGANYLQFLREELPILLEEVPLEIRQRMLFQHDGCPAHFAVMLSGIFRWLLSWYLKIPEHLGRGGTFRSARSLDLTCIYFYEIESNIWFFKPYTLHEMTWLGE